ncbi:unnamed protein product [Zymoseptoria tritici ST99CH_1A5]|uniref:Uncharacterized protein n=1 Tax=Zymoseptoria tritici ST99CH_1A5 TaxID=1276529 RepID=A0A1Y6M1U8_ZYMTR|nr:unnamed protein product [Zymoseptoria tritici ST99CH_1A5]
MFQIAKLELSGANPAIHLQKFLPLRTQLPNLRTDMATTQELHWTECQLEVAQAEIVTLKAELSRARANNTRLAQVNKRLSEQVDAGPDQGGEHASKDSERAAKTVEEQRASDLIWRLGNLEELIRGETDHRDLQLQAVCARIEANVRALGSGIDLQQRRLRESQSRSFEGIANAVRDVLIPLEQALSDSARDSLIEGNVQRAQRDDRRLEEVRRLGQAMIDCLTLD